MLIRENFMDNKRENIIRTAKRLFSEKGFAATGIREIAKEAGVSLGNFYNYFKNKDELFQNIISDEYIMKSVSSLPELIIDCFPDNFSKLILEIKNVIDKNHELYKLIFIDLIEFGGKNTNRIVENLISFIQSIFENDVRPRLVGTRIKDVDYNFYVRTFIIAVVSTFIVNNILPSANVKNYSNEQIAENISNVLLKGILV